jgi:hypothetical protein
MEGYNVHISLLHLNWKTHLTKVVTYLNDKARIQDLSGPRFKVKFSTWEEVDDFVDFLKTLEGGEEVYIFVKCYRGRYKMPNMPLRI